MQKTQEGYQVLPSIDKARYDEIQGMEGPFMTRSGKVVYYDPQEGAYYDRDTDMYLTYDEWKALDEDTPSQTPRPKPRPMKVPRPKPRPVMIGSNPKTGATRGIDPALNYSPEDLKRLLMQSAMERMNEGKMGDLHAEIMSSDDPHGEIYKMLTGNSPEAQYIQAMYNDTSAEYGLHPDDDFEDIIDRMVDEMESEMSFEGHSPHKKGTAKYKKHMAAMHAGMNEGKEKNYICVHAKKGTHQCTADSTYGAAKKAAEFWGMKSTAGIDVHLTDEPKTATEGYVDDEIAAYYRQLKLPNMKSWKKLTRQESVKEDATQRAGDHELLKPMLKINDPQVLKIYANNIIKKYPYMKRSVTAMLPKGESVAQESTETVDINKLKESINMQDASDSAAVAGYVRTLLNSKHNTWEKVDEEIDFVISKLTEGHKAYAEEARTELHKRWMQEYFDKDIKVSENVDTMRKIVKNKSAMPVKFSDGTMKVDMTSANIFLQAYDQMKERNQEKINQMMQTKAGFLRVMDFIYGAMK